MNFESRSEMIALRMPQSADRNVSINITAYSSAVSVILPGISKTRFVNLSVTDSSASNPFYDGSLSTKSMAIVWNGISGGRIGTICLYGVWRFV
jgi:hypothetical protein